MCERLSFVILSVAVLLAGSTTQAAPRFADPPTTGTVLWTFTGAKSSAGTATSVHCSNLDPVKTAGLQIEFFNDSGALVGASNATALLPGGQVDFATGGGTFYGENLVVTGDFEGSVRVISDATKKVICSAHVMSVANPPTFAYDLSPFGKSGKH